MFSAVFVSRGIVNFFYGGRRKIKKLPVGQTHWSEQHAAT
jgi:preprotein translocase subunit SecD